MKVTLGVGLFLIALFVALTSFYPLSGTIPVQQRLYEETTRAGVAVLDSFYYLPRWEVRVDGEKAQIGPYGNWVKVSPTGSTIEGWYEGHLKWSIANAKPGDFVYVPKDTGTDAYQIRAIKNIVITDKASAEAMKFLAEFLQYEKPNWLENTAK